MRWLCLLPLVLRSPRRGRLEGCSRRLGQIALGLMPIVAALHSPSSEGRSSERPSERGDAVDDRVYKSHSPKLQSAPGRARSTVPFGKLSAGFRDASPSAPLLRTRSWRLRSGRRRRQHGDDLRHYSQRQGAGNERFRGAQCSEIQGVPMPKFDEIHHESPPFIIESIAA